MNLDEQYDNFITKMKSSGATPPYMSKTEWMIGNGLASKDEHDLLLVRPKRHDRPCAAKIDNHIANVGKKVAREKKPKAVIPPKAELIRKKKEGLQLIENGSSILSQEPMSKVA